MKINFPKGIALYQLLVKYYEEKGIKPEDSKVTDDLIKDLIEYWKKKNGLK